MLNILHVCVCRSLDRLFWQGGDELGVGISVLWRGLCCREPALGSRPRSAGRENPGKNYTMSFFFSPCFVRAGAAASRAVRAAVRACVGGRGGRDAPGLRRKGPHRSRVTCICCSPASRPRWTRPHRMLLTRRRAKVRRGSWVQVKAQRGREGRDQGGDTSSAATPHEDRPQQHSPPRWGLIRPRSLSCAAR